jgi:hypothetical protein
MENVPNHISALNMFSFQLSVSFYLNLLHFLLLLKELYLNFPSSYCNCSVLFLLPGYLFALLKMSFVTYPKNIVNSVLCF